LAQELGLPSASSALRYFNDIPVIVVERYDRYRQGARVLRIHQEDCCQALGRMPQQKYQNEGGPSSLQIYELIREWSSDPLADQRVFVQSLMFNWLILGTDGHAKNYSVLISPNSQVRLAPLYDIASALPYSESFTIRKVKLAMKIGSQYLVSRIRRNEWLTFATEHQLDPSWMEETIVRLATQIPKCAENVYHEMQHKEFDHPFVENLVRSLSARARECLSQI
jgi:serine/threonine-protein kinase HipA